MTTKRKPTKKKQTGGRTTGVATKANTPTAASSGASAGFAASSGEDAKKVRSRQRSRSAQAEAAKTADGEPRKRKPAKRRWPLRVVLAVFAVALAVVALFSWDRWLRFDDARELQGEWQVEGTTRIVVVDGSAIKLTDDVAYTYVLDPMAKTISFTFGNMAGQGRYRFSADRSQVVVTEGGSPSVWSTLAEDIAWMWDGLVRSAQGQPPAEPVAGEGTTVFVRISHDAAAQPRSDANLAVEPEPEPAPSESAAISESSAQEPPAGQGSPNRESPAEQKPLASDGTADSGEAGGTAADEAPSELFNVSDA